MTKFLIQFEDNIPAYGFCYETIKSIEFNNWINQNEEYNYTSQTLKQISYHDHTDWYLQWFLPQYIPVGSVEFVHKYMELCNIPIPKPINIPEELFGLCCQNPRNFYHINESCYKVDTPKYFKSLEYIKNPLNGLRNKIPSVYDNWQITDPIDILAEWRCFIFKEKLVDCKCYSGDFLCAPTNNYINQCIRNYTSAPIAYTLDIALYPVEGNKDFNADQTVIECHNMYSCGFYGFEGKYPALMQAAWWKQYINKNEDK